MPATSTRSAAGRNGLRQHLLFTALSGALLIVLYSLLRMALLVYNHELIGETTANDLLEAFGNGLRFDLRVVVFVLAPLLLVMGSRRLMAARTWLISQFRITCFLPVSSSIRYACVMVYPPAIKPGALCARLVMIRSIGMP